VLANATKGKKKVAPKDKKKKKTCAQEFMESEPESDTEPEN